jgi:hypothetical protein
VCHGRQKYVDLGERSASVSQIVINRSIEGSDVDSERPDTYSTEMRRENASVMFAVAGLGDPCLEFAQDGHLGPEAMP